MNWFKAILTNRFIRRKFSRLNLNAAVENFPELVKRVGRILVILPSSTSLESGSNIFTSRLYDLFGEVQVSTFNRTSLRETDVNWYGLPSDRYLENIRSEKFDMVIDLNSTPDYICSYLVALSGARLRLNLISTEYDQAYNLHFRSDRKQNPQELTKNILEQLKKLKNFQN